MAVSPRRFLWKTDAAMRLFHVHRTFWMTKGIAMANDSSLAPEPATIHDVARAAGCSTATVSRALNDHPHVSDKTREAVLRAVRAVNFVPLRETAARRKRRPVPPSVNLLDGASTGAWPGDASRHAVPPGAAVVEFVLCRNESIEPVHATASGVDFDAPRPWDGHPAASANERLVDSFFLGLFAGVSEEAAAAGRKTLYHTSRDPMADPTLADAAGPPVVLAGTYHPTVGAYASTCRRPLVLLDLVFDARAPVVTIDNRAGIRLAMQHLFALGHRRIGFAGGRADVVAHAERLDAYRAEMIDAGLPVHSAWVRVGPVLMAEVERSMADMLARTDRPTAVVAINDWVALAVMKAAAHNGLRVPDDLSVVGFDDVEAAPLFRPPLTTVRVDTRALGRLAVRTLLQWKPNAEPFQQRLRPTLTERQSTARPVSGG